MTVARSVADVLTEHVLFEIDCVDRMYCNVYVPQLQYAAGLVGYVHRQLGLPIASTAPLARITEAPAPCSTPRPPPPDPAPAGIRTSCATPASRTSAKRGVVA